MKQPIFTSTGGRSVRLSLVAALLTPPALLASPAGGGAVKPTHSHGAATGSAVASASRAAPRVSVAGDIACGPGVNDYRGGNGSATQCRQKYTSRLISGSDAVWTLGDHVYPSGTLANFRQAYRPTWGRKKAVTYPTPGDHDYDDNRGRGYYAYFGRRPYYAFSMGGWRVFSLNSEISHSAKSRQVRWLKRKLASSRQDCIAAYWSTPRWTSGPKFPGDATFVPFWNALYSARADLVLAGDTHNYERFAPQTPRGARSANGIRQFVVGTGGRSLYGFSHVQPNSQVRRKAFGVLQLRMYGHSYRWRFINEARRTLDSGSARCH